MAENKDPEQTWDDQSVPQEENVTEEQDKNDLNNNEESVENHKDTTNDDVKGSSKLDIQSLYINSSVKQPQKESDGQNAFVSYLIETEVSKRVEPTLSNVLTISSSQIIQSSKIPNS